MTFLLNKKYFLGEKKNKLRSWLPLKQIESYEAGIWKTLQYFTVAPPRHVTVESGHFGMLLIIKYKSMPFLVE